MSEFAKNCKKEFARNWLKIAVRRWCDERTNDRYMAPPIKKLTAHKILLDHPQDTTTRPEGPLYLQDRLTKTNILLPSASRR